MLFTSLNFLQIFLKKFLALKNYFNLFLQLIVGRMRLFQKYLSGLIGDEYRKAGEVDAHYSTLTRWACQLGVKECVDNALRLFNSSIQNFENDV